MNAATPGQRGLDRLAHGWPLGALTALVLGLLIIENTLHFPGSVPYFRSLTGGLGIPDLLPGPDPDRLHRLLTLLGPLGRQQYLVLLVTFDIFFPLLVALFTRAWLTALGLPRLRWISWATLAVDYAENVACGLTVLGYPHESRVIAALAGVLTALKFVGYLASLLLILGGAARSGGRAFRKRLGWE
jgi:hypothetical protein